MMRATTTLLVVLAPAAALQVSVSPRSHRVVMSLNDPSKSSPTKPASVDVKPAADKISKMLNEEVFPKGQKVYDSTAAKVVEFANEHEAVGTALEKAREFFEKARESEVIKEGHKTYQTTAAKVQDFIKDNENIDSTLDGLRSAIRKARESEVVDEGYTQGIKAFEKFSAKLHDFTSDMDMHRALEKVREVDVVAEGRKEYENAVANVREMAPDQVLEAFYSTVNEERKSKFVDETMSAWTSAVDKARETKVVNEILSTISSTVERVREEEWAFDLDPRNALDSALEKLRDARDGARDALDVPTPMAPEDEADETGNMK
mmetsp:Transcript_33290/g.87604  ORF Transcript_33290/g.87604 Transcript_33290/m.87604 type:complete len:319 (+) Transcript_33290:82-1038(+)